MALVRLIQKAATRHGQRTRWLARIERGNVDVIALDHHLATGTGLELVATLKTRENIPPVVYATGSAETSVAVSALKSGAFDYVAKTVSNDFFELPSLEALACRWGDRITCAAGDAKSHLGLSALLVRPDGIVARACETCPRHR